MQQFPTFRLSIIDSVLFVGYIEHIFLLFSIQLLGNSPNLLFATFHLKSLFYFYIHLD